MPTLLQFLDERGMKPELRAFLESDQVRERIVGAIPRGPRGFYSLIEQVIEGTEDRPLVMQCDPTSVVKAIRRAARWELPIGRKAYVIPKRNVDHESWSLTAYQGYLGKMELLERRYDGAPAVEMVEAGLHYSEEPFKHEQGTEPRIQHTPIVDPQKRGELVSAYAWAQPKGSRWPKIVELHRSEIDRIRKEYSSDWADGDLETILWYPVRTAVHRLNDRLTLSPKMRALLDDDGEEFDDVGVVEEWMPKRLVVLAADDPYGFSAPAAKDVATAATITAPVHDPAAICGTTREPDALDIMREGQAA